MDETYGKDLRYHSYASALDGSKERDLSDVKRVYAFGGGHTKATRT